ncbi:hypothetical protein H696_01012 [Fonticula alba]|uniref:Growth factor receptor domain-containing protein n=1 Tax=Fonticula alba TaxID=691883 RepID=A0A058ZHS4_FONAL|nr:hypothetical protein H696_01012 [Fonticula alba]KCV73473.1 hypothetical protein H696_01012 [Fonticula alba]|eukprot:XP_009493174.1 hypothetical protein H696_01012 [Fonticula alba]
MHRRSAWLLLLLMALLIVQSPQVTSSTTVPHLDAPSSPPAEHPTPDRSLAWPNATSPAAAADASAGVSAGPCPSYFNPCSNTQECCPALCEKCTAMPHSCTVKCTACEISYHVLTNYRCHFECPFGHYGVDFAPACLPCHHSCLECMDPYDHCLACVTGVLRPEVGACFQSCPAHQGAATIKYLKKKTGTMPHKVCVDCPANCEDCNQPREDIHCTIASGKGLTCPASTTCWRCKFGYYLLNDEECLSQCPPSYYPDNSTSGDYRCRACAPGCLKCRGPLDSDCDWYHTPPTPPTPPKETTPFDPKVALGVGLTIGLVFLGLSAAVSVFILHKAEVLPDWRSLVKMPTPSDPVPA